MPFQMLYLEELILNWKSMVWKEFQKKTWMKEGDCLNKKLKVDWKNAFLLFRLNLYSIIL